MYPNPYYKNSLEEKETDYRCLYNKSYGFENANHSEAIDEGRSKASNYNFKNHTKQTDSLNKTKEKTYVDWIAYCLTHQPNHESPIKMLPTIQVYYNFLDMNGPTSYYPGSVAPMSSGPYQPSMAYPGQRTKSVIVPTLTQCPTCHRNTLMTSQVIEVPDPDQANPIMSKCPTCQAPMQAQNIPANTMGGSMMVSKLRQCPSCGRNTLWTQEQVNMGPSIQYQETLCTTCRTPMINATQPQMNPYATTINQDMQTFQQPPSVSVPKITNCGTCGQTMISYENISMPQHYVQPSMPQQYAQPPVQQESFMVQKTGLCPECHRNTLVTNELVTKPVVSPTMIPTYTSPPYNPMVQQAQSMVKVPTVGQCPECRRNTLVTYQDVAVPNQNQNYGMLPQMSQPPQQYGMGSGGTAVTQCPSCKRMTLVVQTGPPVVETQKVFCETCMQPIDVSNIANHYSNPYYTGQAQASPPMMPSPSYMTMVNTAGPAMKQSVIQTLTQCPECKRNTLWANQAVSYLDMPQPQMPAFQGQPQQMNYAAQMSYPPNAYNVAQPATSTCPVCMRPLDAMSGAAMCPLCKRPTIF